MEGRSVTEAWGAEHKYFIFKEKKEKYKCKEMTTFLCWNIQMGLL